jgi:peptidoglycan/LPS O-acetylase OafA/YrhL
VFHSYFWINRRKLEGLVLAMNSTHLYKRNGLTFVKLLAAFQVMFIHYVAHFNLNVSTIVASIDGYYNGVPIFLIISGYLIWLSLGRSNNYYEYLKKRFWRIYPELWVAVGAEIVSIIVLYDGYIWGDVIKFAFAQGTIFQFWTPDSLRGYGVGCPNGTLWTICVIIQFYIVSWLVYKFLNKKRFIVWIGGFIVLFILSFFGQVVFEKIDINVLTKLYGHTIIKYGWLFYFGCFVAEYREKMIKPILVKYWILLLVLAAIPYLFDIDIKAGYRLLHSILLTSGLIGVSYAFPQLYVKTDISYGIFLYHMIIANIFIHLGYVHKWRYALFSMLISIVAAYVSYKTIGTWSVKMKELKE